METNYEVKPKKSLRPLKAGLLVLAMVCFVLGTFAQQGQTVKVANDQQVLKALENPSTNTFVFSTGYDGMSFMNSPAAKKAIQVAGDNGRSSTCAYYIIEADKCWWTNTTILNDTMWSPNVAIAGSIDVAFPQCNCCPISLGDDLGTWSWRRNPPYNPPLWDNPPPPGGWVKWLDPINKDTMDFLVNKPGVYTLRYYWADPWFSYAQTEYRFFDDYDLSLEAPDTCGLETVVHMELSSYFRFGKDTIIYWLTNECRDITLPFTGPPIHLLSYFHYYGNPPAPVIDNDTLQIEDIPITVPDFGIWYFCARIQPKAQYMSQMEQLCLPEELCIPIDFSKEPIANAGLDACVCDDLCYQLSGSTGLWDECDISPNYWHKWTKVSGPGLIGFTNPYNLNTEVCRDEETCSYGQYVIALEVTNGTCHDTDYVTVTFDEQPTAWAGIDQYLCDTLCFNLEDTAYVYCSPAPVPDLRYHFWTFLSGPPGNTYDIEDPEVTGTEVCVTPNQGACPYGEWKFIYTEVNGCCIAHDTVSIFLFEQPFPDAGDDQVLCNDFAFSLIGSFDPTCYYNTVIGIEWSLIEQPDDCTVDIVTPYDLNPDVYISECGPCPYGDYVFRLTQYNGYINAAGEFEDVCVGYDEVTVCIAEQPIADAGLDTSMCYYGGCFNLNANPFPYCNNEPCGERFGKWTKVGGPAAVEFSDENDPDASACPDETVDCVYGMYTFVWTETNEPCVDADTMIVCLYEPPTADGGDDAEYCVDREFSMELWHTFMAEPYEYCQEAGCDEPVHYWTKCGGPGYVTFTEENNPGTRVHVTAYGCYCFVWHEVNGDCEATDTVHVCWYEHPHLEGDISDTACLAEMPTCYDLGALGLVPYEYLPAPNVNYNHQGWEMIYGTGNAVFADPEDPNTDVCVDQFGCYTFAFIQWNGVEWCSDTAYAYLTYFQKPTADAGDDAEVCGSCIDFSAHPFSYVVNECAPAENHYAYMDWFSYIPPADPCPTDDYVPFHDACGWYYATAEGPFCLCDDYCGTYYGTYGFIWHEFNGVPECADEDTVWYTLKKTPDPVPLRGCFNPNNSCQDENNWCYIPGEDGEVPTGWNPNECGSCYIECLWPDDTVLTVCAESCLSFSIDWPCLFQSLPQNYWCEYGPVKGWTYEWSFIGPAGSYFNADPLWWDCDAECWRGSDQIDICFGECCDTARLYLTITTPEGCVTTEEWKFYVQHRPDATISGPEVAEVGTPVVYQIPEPQNPCYLYIWEVQHCGVITSGQGTGMITVNWTNYNINGGWGLVYVEVHDTCTGCCNTDSLWVKVYPSGTLGTCELSGHVYYHNNIQTPLNGVEITLWNSGVPVFTTTSFNDVEGGGVGYYEFNGINCNTNFNITASYGAPWYGANATDALAVELKVINNLPSSFLWDNLVAEAMDVNNSNSISATDALWIKQRAISMVNYFPAGNWVYWPNMASTAGVFNFSILNAGDANRSNIPASMKETPAIALVSDGVMNVTIGQEYELPIRIANANQFGAMTLNLGYNTALLDVVDVVASEGMLSSIADGNVSIAWSSINPMVLADNDVVVTLKVKALGVTSASDEMFTIGLGSEFADPSATVIEPVTLKTYGISTEPAATDYFLSANRPNPFSTSTFIEYTLPETGKVKLSILDMLGQELEVLVEATQTAGSYTVEFANPGLATGVYIYKITVDGETRDYISTQRMVIAH